MFLAEAQTVKPDHRNRIAQVPDRVWLTLSVSPHLMSLFVPMEWSGHVEAQTGKLGFWLPFSSLWSFYWSVLRTCVTAPGLWRLGKTIQVTISS